MTEKAATFGPVCEAVIKKTHRITPESTDEVRHIVLQIDEPSFRFMEGQSIGVVVSGPHEFGNKYHMRRYSIANARQPSNGENIHIDLLVRRCFYIDEINGERYPGVASNYLCDAKAGDRITISGPYRSPFQIPTDPNTNLLMIGTGTGIAPFRAFIQNIYRKKGQWNGKVQLYYGARTGMDMLYMNDQNDDLTNYYDEVTFEAFQAVGARILSGEEAGLERSLKENIDSAWELLRTPNTHVFVAGLEKTERALDRVLSEKAGGTDTWESMKRNLKDEGRWSELLYH